MQKSGPSDTVTILLGTYNGAQYLPEQLQSIADQTHRNWQLLASDDASTDGTTDILDDFGRMYPVTRLTGPGRGHLDNFLHLLASLPEGASQHGTAVAFCDQDDVWLPEKIAVALDWVAQVPSDQPALYCSSRLIWDPKRDLRQPSLAYRRPPAFANACVENIAPGNTIVLNPAAAQLAQRFGPTAANVYAHDWWLYLLITGVGGHVFYDPEPHILYRQHDSNAIGAGEQFSRSIRNKGAVWRGAFADRVGRNIDAMQQIAAHLTPENQQCLSLFAQARQASLPRRLGLMHEAGLYRQGRLSGLTFWGAACLGKV